MPQFEDDKNNSKPPLGSAEDMAKYRYPPIENAFKPKISESDAFILNASKEESAKPRSSVFDEAVTAKYLDENDYAMPAIAGHRRMR